MWRQATATGSSWNCTWNWRCTYSLGCSGYGHFSLSLNSCAMSGWSSIGRVSSHLPSHQSASWPMPVTQHLSMRADERRQPVGVELDEREVQVRVALGHAAADELADELRGTIVL